LTPQRLLADLYAEPERLASAAPHLSDVERAALHRTTPQWTPADVPLLDEAAELLGEDDRLARARAAREEQERIEFAEGVLEVLEGSKSMDDEEAPEFLSATDLIAADELAGRYYDGEPPT